MSIKNKVAAFFSLCFVVLVAFITGIIVYERRSSSRFKNTPLKISERDLKSEWGEPKRISQNGETKVSFYNSLFTYYAFSIDENNKVIRKYQD
ncbi:hypothetical protein AB670_03742 [Chryseobacterium sp. MOF25P]|uniref:hypothetical protein n=1 Tax=unclassified Chryseobacterium TaxID=2593645 RepID=UPI000805391F|nr:MULTISPECIES: hypothetical protein [unclassified Chryseobacterium]OBW39916.1 hypothetical protein AB670_03742 [Chryseobacterium sp. MOF25P]OBW43683.1 hypothetical protein AB671_04231 [Chryseobacterium sp. BGARF1]